MLTSVKHTRAQYSPTILPGLTTEFLASTFEVDATVREPVHIPEFSHEAKDLGW